MGQQATATAVTWSAGAADAGQPGPHAPLWHRHESGAAALLPLMYYIHKKLAWFTFLSSDKREFSSISFSTVAELQAAA